MRGRHAFVGRACERVVSHGDMSASGRSAHRALDKCVRSVGSSLWGGVIERVVLV